MGHRMRLLAIRLFLPLFAGCVEEKVPLETGIVEPSSMKSVPPTSPRLSAPNFRIANKPPDRGKRLIARMAWSNASRTATFAVALHAVVSCSATDKAPVPPPPEQTTAHCAAPTYATDQFVCTDTHFRALDQQLATLWAEVDTDPHTTETEREAQAAWFRKRSMCAFETDQAPCVEVAYRARIDALRRTAAR